MYTKDGKISSCKAIKLNGRWISNPSEEQILEAGWIPYVPPVPTERDKALAEINDCKSQLFESDYKAIKFAEGELSATDYEPIRLQRRALRQRINELEKLINPEG